jgi:hypothetical protein
MDQQDMKTLFREAKQHDESMFWLLLILIAFTSLSAYNGFWAGVIGFGLGFLWFLTYQAISILAFALFLVADKLSVEIAASAVKLSSDIAASSGEPPNTDWNGAVG